jgi:hypothetical protein
MAPLSAAVGPPGGRMAPLRYRSGLFAIIRMMPVDVTAGRGFDN